MGVFTGKKIFFDQIFKIPTENEIFCIKCLSGNFRCGPSVSFLGFIKFICHKEEG